MRGAWRKRALETLVLGALVAMVAGPAQAVTISITIGDDDGFNGTQACNPCNPGDAYDPGPHAALLDLAPPGVYSNQTDAQTVSPYEPYTLTYDFGWDTTGLASVSNATVTVQSGSVARRTDGSGFGFAQVSATDGASTLPLGDFLTASDPEETVKAHVFGVTTLIPFGTVGTLTLTIDGSALANPNDLFGLDFAVLEIQESVPEPGTLALLGSAVPLLGLAWRRRRGRDLSLPPAS